MVALSIEGVEEDEALRAAETQLGLLDSYALSAGMEKWGSAGGANGEKVLLAAAKIKLLQT